MSEIYVINFVMISLSVFFVLPIIFGILSFYGKSEFTEYVDSYECVKSPFIGKRRVKKDFFSKKEANLMRILYYMDKAIDEDESGILYKDISSFEHVPKSKKKNMNSAIAKMYYILGK